MPAAELTPAEAARLTARADLPLDGGRHAGVAATANHIHSVVSVLRELDFGDTPPASAYRAQEENTEDEITRKADSDAAV
ncbi:hypothetical protein HUO13_15285 [Saccharopolyspora erythraea]|uniref:hypothetical protein n=1 Tax=Saccharopolyspora erythraea TaxID=1836 RepID=UPI001BABCA66|nr:hypothetical protein [Saccharopolyspora erythraea]QUH01984.1 hypothetical protein HUO13_15285 [Saccharopolyspora erythraea]